MVRLKQMCIRDSANDAPVMKRWRPKAKGSAYPILKRSSHIGVTVAEK